MKLFQKLRELIPHLCLAMALGLIVITYVDGRNPLMKFLSSGTSKTYLYLLAALTILTAVFCIVSDNRRR